jgi:hypothetical protein
MAGKLTAPAFRGRPRIEEKHKTQAATKPWIALGMSESTWRRRRKEKKDKLRMSHDAHSLPTP